MDLHQEKCVPCEAGVPILVQKEIEEYLRKLNGPGPTSRTADPRFDESNRDWQLIDLTDRNGTGAKIKKRAQFKNFKEALMFVNKVGELAEIEGHHPDIAFGWGYAEVTLWTHKIKGLSRNDFVLASKIDKIL